MKTLIALALFVAIAVASAPLLHADSEHAIKGQYIVVLSNITKTEKFEHVVKLYKFIKAHDDENKNKVLSSFSIVDFQGYSAILTPKVLHYVREQQEVLYVEQDQQVFASGCTKQTGAVWGLDRITERNLNLDGVYPYPSSAGSGVDAYVVDTGILTSHNEFGGRASWGGNFVGDKKDTDCNGHGTHVAGTIGGTTYGVAKNVHLIAVKVLGCTGSGSNSGVINGINYVVTQHGQRKRPSVANMSLGGSKSTASNTAVANAVKAGVSFAVAAGNENQDACNVSPASEPTAITVGATTVADENGNELDARASFSNFGTCVHIFAPGELITSAWINSNTATKTISGTSMATPHVAGAAAVYLAQHPTASPAAVKSHLTGQSTTNKIDLDCSTSTNSAQCKLSPNKLLYSNC